MLTHTNFVLFVCFNDVLLIGLIFVVIQDNTEAVATHNQVFKEEAAAILNKEALEDQEDFKEVALVVDMEDHKEDLVVVVWDMDIKEAGIT